MTKQPRTHVKNPSVTVIMETVGGHQDRIETAIRSFMAQTYRNAWLLIVNSHPERLVLKDAPGNVIVHNCRDVFRRPVELHAYSVALVVTDCWTILDDDDRIAPTHLQQLVDFWNLVAPRTEKPLQVCNPHAWACYADGPRPLEYKGWWNSLFERLTPAEVEYCWRLFPKDRICGSDTWIASNSYYDQRLFDGERTYYWDRTGGRHISSHETCVESAGPAAAFEVAARYWRQKLAAHAAPLRPVWLGEVDVPAPSAGTQGETGPA